MWRQPSYDGPTSIPTDRRGQRRWGGWPSSTPTCPHPTRDHRTREGGLRSDTHQPEAPTPARARRSRCARSETRTPHPVRSDPIVGYLASAAGHHRHRLGRRSVLRHPHLHQVRPGARRHGAVPRSVRERRLDPSLMTLDMRSTAIAMRKPPLPAMRRPPVRNRFGRCRRLRERSSCAAAAGVCHRDASAAVTRSSTGCCAGPAGHMSAIVMVHRFFQRLHPDELCGCGGRFADRPA